MQETNIRVSKGEKINEMSYFVFHVFSDSTLHSDITNIIGAYATFFNLERIPLFHLSKCRVVTLACGGEKFLCFKEIYLLFHLHATTLKGINYKCDVTFFLFFVSLFFFTTCYFVFLNRYFLFYLQFTFWFT